MTDRIKRMKDALNTDKYPICTEKYRATIDSMRRNEGLPNILQRAHATADYLDMRTLYVDEDELIVGNVAAKPHGMEASVWGKFWSDEDIDLLSDTYIFDPDEMKIIRSYDDFWDARGRTMQQYQGYYYDDFHLWPFIKSGILCPPWKDKQKGRGGGGAGFGWGLGIGASFFVADYGKIIGTGIQPFIDKAEAALHEIRYNDQDSIEKKIYLDSVIIALSAMVRMYHRYGNVCTKAAESASEPRRSELLRMADSCH